MFKQIERATVQPYFTQVSDAVHNLSHGFRAQLIVPNYAITAYVQWATDLAECTIYATWRQEHSTGEITGGTTLVLPRGDHRRAAVVTYADLETSRPK